MPAVEQIQNQSLFFEEMSVRRIETMNCFQVRANLDALFDGESRLEETTAGIKRSLFNHLEICRSCCRAFDARVRFRPAPANRIY